MQNMEKKQIPDINRKGLLYRVEMYNNLRDNLADEIKYAVGALTEGSDDNAVVLLNEVDCATCDPIVQLEIDCAVDENGCNVSLHDLSLNELAEIAQHLLAGNYNVADKNANQ